MIVYGYLDWFVRNKVATQFPFRSVTKRMNSSRETASPRNVIRWCIIVTAIWMLNGATLILSTYSSLRKPLDVGGRLTERITATTDPAAQQELNLLMVKVVDNRIAAIKSLQRRVIIFASGAIATGAFTIWFLVDLRRALRPVVTYELV